MALSIPKRTSDPVFIRRVVNGKTEFIRQPMNVVTLDFQDVRGLMTFVEPAASAIVVPSGAINDVAEQIRVYDSDPYPGSSFSY